MNSIAYTSEVAICLDQPRPPSTPRSSGQPTRKDRALRLGECSPRIPRGYGGAGNGVWTCPSDDAPAVEEEAQRRLNG